MLYTFAKIVMTAGLRFFYRHIYVTGLSNIPSTGPVILIANHNASLMDAALLGILLKRKAYFFARGDVFVNKAVQQILWWFHMMPVHGYQGGRNTLGVNKSSFSSAQQILTAGGIIVFFPESSSHTDHHLLPFRKGAFRLAFDTVAAAGFSFNIPIIPVGITYDHPVDCRKAVQVHAGRPLLLADYVDEYRQNVPAALLRICKDAHQAVHKLVLHVNDKNRLQTVDQLATINRNDNPDKFAAWIIRSNRPQLQVQQICAAVNNTNAVDFENTRQQATAYFTSLHTAGVEDKTTTRFFSFASSKRLLLWVGFPLYLLGLVLNGLPILLARNLADKKVTRIDFYSWIFVVCYSVGYTIWMLTLAVICLTVGWQYALLVLVVMMGSGLFAYVYKGWLHSNHQQKTWRALPDAVKKELQVMRQACKKTLNQPIHLQPEF